MASIRSISDRIWLVLKGLAMGTANKVPGVSGGVVAFVAGFYEEFIYSLQKINRKAFLLLFNRGLKPFLEYTNARFIGLLFLGMIISYFSISKILDYLLVNFELYVWSTFFWNDYRILVLYCQRFSKMEPEIHFFFITWCFNRC